MSAIYPLPTPLGVLGTYTFATPDLAPGSIRDLRDPDAHEDDEA